MHQILTVLVHNVGSPQFLGLEKYLLSFILYFEVTIKLKIPEILSFHNVSKCFRLIELKLRSEF